jgi:hypothetical protein
MVVTHLKSELKEILEFTAQHYNGSNVIHIVKAEQL